ncbi:hypothetical protein VNI00_013869 [Paramarasmius palmivorus]|uniref:Uncharacterized protein n=1 Tax=Paramarasmius palmivorus TaxID=297713 RepID=A0AAW0BVS0_9AGAR
MKASNIKEIPEDIALDCVGAPLNKPENAVKRWYEGGEAAVMEREAEVKEVHKSIRVLQKQRDKKAVARGKERARQKIQALKDKLREQTKDKKGKGKAKKVVGLSGYQRRRGRW